MKIEAKQIFNTKPKPWYLSKTLWFNAIAIAIVVLTGLEGLISSGQAITLVGVVNLILRAYTQAKLE